MLRPVPAIVLGILYLSIVTTRGGADEPPVTGVEQYVAQLKQARTALEAGDRPGAIKALESIQLELPSTPERLLRHLASRGEGEPNWTGNPAPKPELRHALSVLHPLEPTIAYACDLGNVVLFDLREPQMAAKSVVASRKKPLVCGSFSSDGRFFAAGDTEGGVTVWDTGAWNEVASFAKGSRPVRSVALNPDGSKLLAETVEGVILWKRGENQEGGQEIGVVGKRYNFGTALCFSGDGRTCATGGLSSVVISNAQDGEHIREIPHAPYTMHVCFSPSGKQIASGLRGSLNSWVGVFDVATGETVFDQARHERGITGLVFLDEGRCLLSTSADGTMKFWHIPSGTELLSLQMGSSIYQPSVATTGSLIYWNQRGGARYFRLQ